MNKPKSYAPGDTWNNLQLAMNGRLDSRLVSLVSFVRHLLLSVPKPDVDALRIFNTIMLGAMKHSLKTKSGRFFRELADVIETEDQLTDKQRLWLLAMCMDFVAPGKQKRFFTCNELVSLAKDRIGWIVTPRRMLTVCNQLGIKLSKDKEGRPRKTRNKLSKRQS